MTPLNEPQDSNKFEQQDSRGNPAKLKRKGVKGVYSPQNAKVVNISYSRGLHEELKQLGFDPRETIELLVQTLVRRTHKARGLPQRLDLYPRAALARDARLSRVLQGDSLSPENLERLEALNRKAKRVARRKRELEREGKL